MVPRRALHLLVAGLISLPVIYLAVLGLLAMRSGLSWREMDANRDGRTSIHEVLDAADIGRRTVDVAGHPCLELYYLKDGSRAKLVCPAA